MALGGLPLAANGLLLVPIGNVGGHYVWYLVIVVIFMGLGRTKRLGRKATVGRGRAIFLGVGDDPCARHHSLASLPELYLLFQPLFHLELVSALLCSLG